MNSGTNYLGKQVYKICLVGDTRVGKTSIRRRYLGEGFDLNLLSTLGTEFSMKVLEDSVLQVWDLAGENDFSFLRKSYYVGAHGIIMVFDLSNPDSFTNLSNWVDELENHLDEHIPIVLVGNKQDLIENTPAPIMQEQIDEYATILSKRTGQAISYFYSSALTGFNIESLFDKLLGQIDIS